MSRLTRERGSLHHDDTIDAVAMAVQGLNSFCCIDEHKATSDRAWAAFEREHREHQAFQPNRRNNTSYVFGEPSSFWAAM